MKVVIIGGGISGCAAYLQLTKHLPKPSPDADHEITIYEPYSTDIDATSSDRPEGHTHSSTLVVGGGLGVGANGLHVLKRLDEELLRDVVRGGYAVDHSNLKTKNGAVLIRMETKVRRSEDDQPMHMVGSSRHSLWKCLRMRIPDSAITNKGVLEVIANANGRNVVRFADGSPDVEADLIIGADGIRSTSKRALFPEAKEDPYPPRYEGLVGIGGFLPASDIKSQVEKGSMNFVFGGNGFFGYFYSESAASDPKRDSPYVVSEPGDTISWWSTYAIDECPDHKSIDRDDVARQLRERHSQWRDPVVQKVIHSVRVENMYPTWTSPQLPTWERDGVVLVGDAAHALPSTSGQGSSQALEDVEAFVLFLSYYLRKEYDDPHSTVELKKAIKIAAKRYVDLRQPHIMNILAQAQKMQNNKRNMGLIQEYIMYIMMWILGCFSGLFSKSMNAVTRYNIAEDVHSVLNTERSGD